MGQFGDAGPGPGGGAIVRITPHGDGILPALGELWAYRDLLFVLVLRDFSVRYKQTIAGPSWVVLQPLIALLAMTGILDGRELVGTGN